MNKKKIIFEVVLFVIITGLTIYYLIASGIFKNISDLKSLTFGTVMFVLGCIFIYVSCDSFIIYRNMKTIKKKAVFFEGYETYLTGNLGSLVTPSRIGHFPIIFFYFKKKRLNVEESLSVICSNQIIYSFTLPLLYGAFMIYSIVNNCTVKIGEVYFPLFVVSLIGVLTNIAYFVVIVLMMYNIKFQNFMVNIECKLLKKFKKSLNEEEWKFNKRLKMTVYKNSAEIIRHNVLRYIPSVIAYVIFMIFCYGMPYFCYLALTDLRAFNITDYLYCFLLCQAMSYVTNITPTPGGMIAAEFSFIQVFQAFMGTLVNGTLLLYRFTTYFLMIIVDFIFFAIFMLVRFMKDKKYDEKQRFDRTHMIISESQTEEEVVE